MDLRLYVGILERLLKIYSPSGGEARAAEELVRIASELGLEGRVDQAGNAIISWGEGDRSVALIGHIDTVPGYIEVVSDGQRIRGRGAVDAKGPLASMLGALNELRRELPEDVGRVYVIACVDEEGESRGARELIRSGFKADSVIIGEPTNTSKVVVGYRGSVKVAIRCSSRGGHASSPWIYDSACERLIAAWEKVSKMYRGTRASETSTALTMLKCGEYHNTIPSEGLAVVDIRYPVGGPGWAEILESIRSSLGQECSATLLKDPVEPVEVRPTVPVVRALIRAVSRAGMSPRIAVKMGTSDMNLLAGRVSSSIAAYGPGKSELSHTTEEEITYDEIEKGVLVYKEAVKILVGSGIKSGL